jgi:methionyl-tRNA synthetase
MLEELMSMGQQQKLKLNNLVYHVNQLCDKYSGLHKQIYDWLMISFDCYGRSSQPNGDPSIPQLDWPQTRITHDIFKNLCQRGYVVEKEESTMYSPDLGTFVADRFVECICPYCKYDKANSDQCDKCSKLLLPEDVVDPKYKPDVSKKLVVKTTTNLYIDTDRIWQEYKMTDLVRSRISWTKTAIDITEDWLKMGLKPRSITRDLKWGTSIPDTPEFGSKYNKKVMYVWVEAPIAYISITEKCLGREKSESLWKDPETHIVQFMAKDNVPFHSVIFPATLRGSGYTTAEKVDLAAIEYLLYEGQKFSKTHGIGVFCDDMIRLSEKYSLLPDYWRAYLIFIRPESSDSNFVLNGPGGFVDFINNILIKNLGNLIHRVLSISYQIHNKHAIDTLVHPIINEDLTSVLDNDLNSLNREYVSHMDSYRLCDGYKTCLKFSTRLNVYINEVEPWVLIKDNNRKEELYGSMVNLYRSVIKLAHIIEPVMPTIGANILHQYNASAQGDEYVVILPKVKPVIMINPVESIHLSD